MRPLTLTSSLTRKGNMVEFRDIHTYISKLRYCCRADYTTCFKKQMRGISFSCRFTMASGWRFIHLEKGSSCSEVLPRENHLSNCQRAMFRRILLRFPSHRNAIYYSTSDLFSQEEFWNFFVGGRYGTRTRGSLLAKQVQLPLCQSPI